MVLLVEAVRYGLALKCRSKGLESFHVGSLLYLGVVHFQKRSFIHESIGNGVYKSMR